MLPAEQTYTDGTVVKWADTAEGGEHPAPVLYVNDAAPAAESRRCGGQRRLPRYRSGASDDLVARAMGLGGLVLGAVAVVIA